MFSVLMISKHSDNLKEKNLLKVLTVSKKVMRISEKQIYAPQNLVCTSDYILKVNEKSKVLCE